MGEYSFGTIKIHKNRINDFCKALAIATGKIYVYENYGDGSGELTPCDCDGYSVSDAADGSGEVTIMESMKWDSYTNNIDNNMYNNLFKPMMSACEIMGNVTFHYSGLLDEPSFTKDYGPSTNKDSLSSDSLKEYVSAHSALFCPVIRTLAHTMQDGGTVFYNPQVYPFCRKHDYKCSAAYANITNFLQETGKGFSDTFTKEEVEEFLSLTGTSCWSGPAIVKPTYFNEDYRDFCAFMNSIGVLDFAKEHGVPAGYVDKKAKELLQKAYLAAFSLDHSSLINVYKGNYSITCSDGFGYDNLASEKIYCNLKLAKTPDINDFFTDGGAVRYPESPKGAIVFSDFTLGKFADGKFSFKKYATIEECLANVTNSYALRDFLYAIDTLKDCPEIIDMFNITSIEKLAKDRFAEVKRIECANQEPIILHVKFSEKDEAKDLGALWNSELKTWYIPFGDYQENPDVFEKWKPEVLNTEQASNDIER